MELKYEIALYICGAVALVYIVLTFISLHRRRKYKGGSKVVVPDYLKNLPYYKFKVRSYKVMKVLIRLRRQLSRTITGTSSSAWTSRRRSMNLTRSLSTS